MVLWNNASNSNLTVSHGALQKMPGRVLLQKFIEEVFFGIKLHPRARAPGSLKLTHFVKVKGERNVVVPDVPAVFAGRIDGF